MESGESGGSALLTALYRSGTEEITVGLEMVEMVLRVEDVFGIRVPDEDMFPVRTVGDLHDYIVARLADLPPAQCASSTAFYRVRASLCETLGVSRHDVRPDTTLESLFHGPERHAQWTSFAAAASAAGVPCVWRLAQQPWLVRSMTALFGAVGVLALAAGFGGVPWTVPLLALVVAIAANCAVNRLAARMPRQYRNVGELCKAVGEQLALSEDDVWRLLVQITVEVLGVKPDQVTRDARWVEDLGAG